MFKYRLYLALLIAGIVPLIVLGCAKTQPVGDLENTTWILESYGEQVNLQPPIAETRITATFDSIEGQVRGSAGCNSYFGDYQINSGLSISMLGHTEMYCMEPEGVMEQENEYLGTLQSARSYQIQDGKLQINCANQKMLIYVAQGE